MNIKLFLLALAVLSGSNLCPAQANEPAPADDWKPATSNQPTQPDTSYSHAIGDPGGRRYNPAPFHFESHGQG